MIIREMKTVDVLQLRQLFNKVRKECFYWETKNYHIMEFDQQTIDESVYVCEKQGRIIGFISVYVPDNFVHHLYVEQSETGQGIGRALLQTVIALRNEPLSLKCVSDNEAALQFYKQLGWEKVRLANDDEYSYWLLKYFKNTLT